MTFRGRVSENSIMFFAVIAFVAVVEIFDIVRSQPSKATSMYPPMCFPISSDDLTGYAPATWLERHGLKNLVKKMVLHKCTSEVDGKQVESEILVPWVKQSGTDRKDTH